MGGGGGGGSAHSEIRRSMLSWTALPAAHMYMIPTGGLRDLSEMKNKYFLKTSYYFNFKKYTKY